MYDIFLVGIWYNNFYFIINENMAFKIVSTNGHKDWYSYKVNKVNQFDTFIETLPVCRRIKNWHWGCSWWYTVLMAN